MIKACSIAIVLLVSCTGITQANCTLGRFEDLAKLRQLKDVFAPELEEFKLKKDEFFQKGRDEKKKRNTPPIDLSVSGAVDVFNEETVEVGALRFTYDINVPAQLLRRKKSKALEKSYNNRVSNVDLEEDIYFLEKILATVFSDQQKSIYEKRLKLLEDKLAYYLEKKRQGDAVVAEISKTKLEIITLKNKILAVNSRLKMVTVDFPKMNYKLLNNEIIKWDPFFREFKCEMTSFEKSVARDNIEFYRNQKKLDFLENTTSLSIYGSSDLKDLQKSPTYGVGLTLRILSPKQRGEAILASQAGLDQAFRDLKLAEIRLRKLYLEQRSVEELIMANLKAVDAEISERQRLLDELQVRASLGQTTFEEKISVELEQSNLIEVRMQRVYDLYLGWLQFINVRGLEN